MKKNKHKIYKMIFNGLMTLTVGVGTIFTINACNKNKYSHKKEPLNKSQINAVSSTLQHGLHTSLLANALFPDSENKNGILYFFKHLSTVKTILSEDGISAITTFSHKNQNLDQIPDNIEKNNIYKFNKVEIIFNISTGKITSLSVDIEGEELLTVQEDELNQLNSNLQKEIIHAIKINGNSINNWDRELPSSSVYKVDDTTFTTDPTKSLEYQPLKHPKSITLPEPKIGESIIIDGLKINPVIDKKVIYDQILPNKLFLLENGDIPKYTTDVESALGYVSYQPATLDEVINSEGIEIPLPTSGKEFDNSLLTLGMPKIGSEYSRETMPSIIVENTGVVIPISKLSEDIFPGAEFNPNYISLKVIDSQKVEINYAGIDTGQIIYIQNSNDESAIDEKLWELQQELGTPNWYSPGNHEHLGEYPIFYDGIDTGLIFPYSNDIDVATTMLKNSNDIPHDWYNIGKIEIQLKIPNSVVPNPVEHPEIIIVNNGVETKVSAITSQYKYDALLPPILYKIEDQGNIPVFTTDETKTFGYIEPVPAHSASILNKYGENILLPIELAGKKFDPTLVTLGKPSLSSTYTPVIIPTIKGQEISIEGFNFKPGADIDYQPLTMIPDPNDQKLLMVYYGGIDTEERYEVENNQDKTQVLQALIDRKQWATEENEWYGKGIAEKSGVYEVFYNGIDTGVKHEYNKSWKDATLAAQQDQNFPHEWLNIGEESFKGFIPEPVIPDANVLDHIIVIINGKSVNYHKTTALKWDYNEPNGEVKPLYIKEVTTDNIEYTTNEKEATTYFPGKNPTPLTHMDLVAAALNSEEAKIIIDDIVYKWQETTKNSNQAVIPVNSINHLYLN